MTLASRQENTLGAALGLCAGGLFAFGFIGVAQALGAWGAEQVGFSVVASQWCAAGAFPLLALFFHLSMPSPRSAARASAPWLSLLPALAVAYGFGLWLPGPGEIWPDGLPQRGFLLTEILVFTPLAEEWLFRGWLYSVVERIAPGLATATNPLPTAAWASALGFSAWHLQNLAFFPTDLVIFQVAYAFPLGLWLGWLRWKTGSLWAPLTAHALVNFGTALG
ncbi:CPBP family intramembrane metalloprotease [bacterium]|nr:CPBP family intramembrane metalloprotease [bacterium]